MLWLFLPNTSFFLGSGSYNHYIPEALKHLLNRSEIYTAIRLTSLK